MIDTDDKRTKWLHIRLSPTEYKKIQTLRSKSISPKLSEYARRVILNLPVTIRQRNQSMDEFMAEMIKLRTELSAIGNNFNQAVHKLHLLKNINDYKVWVLMNETTKLALMEKVEEIKKQDQSICRSVVAVINPSPSLNDAVNYNEHKVREQVAEFIHAANYPKDTEKLGITDRLNMLKNLAALNQRTELNAIHISLNFHPSENLDKQKLTAIADSYMEKIGFGKQPYLVYEHRDAAHPHIHIVTTNIRSDGTGINTFNLGKNESKAARIQIEKDFGLVTAQGRGNNIWEMPPIDIEKVQYGKRPTKQAIANVVNYVTKNYKFSSIPEFNAILEHYNILADRGEMDSGMYKRQGLVYRVLDDKGRKIGVPIKASSISTKPTIKNLSNKFERNKTGKERFKQDIKSAIDWALLQNPGMKIDQLGESLRGSNIHMLIRKNDQGILYGITFIDHKHKVVFNGSDLGDKYSLKAIQERCKKTPDGKLTKKNNEQSPERLRQIKSPSSINMPRQIYNSPLQRSYSTKEIRRQVAAISKHPWTGSVSFIPEFLQVTQVNDQTPHELTAKKKKKRKRRY